MTTTTHPQYIGIDVSKAELVICDHPTQASYIIANTPSAIDQWLKQRPHAHSVIALEATSTYHLAVTNQAYACGHTIYLLDGYRLSRYRDAIGHRAKTDASDATLLRRYLSREIQALRRWVPAPKEYEVIQRLMRRRAKLVKSCQSIRQSVVGLGLPEAELAALFDSFKALIAAIDQQITALMNSSGWQAAQKRCAALEGFGPLTSTAVTVAWHRGDFRSADAFVSFLGLDVRVRDSGKQSGRRKLTKKGAPELRRLLYCAAMSAARSATWRPFYEACLRRGLKPIQAFVALARKLLRIAFALLKNKSVYAPKVYQITT